MEHSGQRKIRKIIGSFTTMQTVIDSRVRIVEDYGKIYTVDKWWLYKAVNRTIPQVLEFFPNARFRLQREWNPEGCERKICLFLDRSYILKYWSPKDDIDFETMEKLDEKYLYDNSTNRFFTMCA